MYRLAISSFLWRDRHATGTVRMARFADLLDTRRVDSSGPESARQIVGSRDVNSIPTGMSDDSVDDPAVARGVSGRNNAAAGRLKLWPLGARFSAPIGSSDSDKYGSVAGYGAAIASAHATRLNGEIYIVRRVYPTGQLQHPRIRQSFSRTEYLRHALAFRTPERSKATTYGKTSSI
jgi:hypothetical protein